MDLIAASAAPIQHAAPRGGVCFTDFSGTAEARILTQAHLQLRYAKSQLLSAISNDTARAPLAQLASILEVSRASFLDAVALYEGIPLMLHFNHRRPPAVGFLWLDDEKAVYFSESGKEAARVRSEHIDVITLFLSRCA